VGVLVNVVLMHDWLTGFRGGERVLEVFCELFPEAPLYTLIRSQGSTGSQIIEGSEGKGRLIQESFLQRIPKIHQHYRKFLPLFPLAAQKLKLPEKCDLILSSSHCVIKGVPKRKACPHISYIHSPMRYIYDQFPVYFGQDAPIAQRIAGKLFRSYLQNWDKQSNRNVDVMVANSQFVADRIKEHYGVTSQVVHPFVELDDFQQNYSLSGKGDEKGDYFLMVSAMAPNKRVDLAIEAMRRCGKVLKIVGKGQLERELRKQAIGLTNVEFLGSRSRSEIVKLLQGAKALIFPGIEDFGIVPLEALAAGTPVIAFQAGGVLETLNQQTGVFFDQANVESLLEAIEECEARKFDSESLKRRANDFSKEKFKTKMVTLMEEVVGPLGLEPRTARL
jgi:glycosyltransferase involved in cell wall biosynthesis